MIKSVGQIFTGDFGPAHEIADQNYLQTSQDFGLRAEQFAHYNLVDTTIRLLM